MINIYPLFSGSKGNAILVSDNDTSILFDCGVSLRRFESAMNQTENNPAKIKGVFVTHEHIDHIRSVPAFVKKYATRIYSTPPTLDYISQDSIVEAFKTPLLPGEPINIGTLEITAFRTSHDALFPVGYTVSDGKSKIAIATDTGCITAEMEKALTGCDKVMIEANHDPNMLLTGRYPSYLKKRIYGEKGHLSNVDCGKLCVKLAKSGTEKILLGHLSEENNTSQLAYGTVGAILKESMINIDEDIIVRVAKPSMTGI